MTLLEKTKTLYPDLDEDDIVNSACPSDMIPTRPPEHCEYIHDGGDHEACRACWSREADGDGG